MIKKLTVPATLESLATIGQFVLELAQDADVQKLSAYRARLAVDEIATNAVVYGGAARNGEGVFEAIGEISDQALTITLDDSGAAFDPRQTPAPDVHLPVDERGIGGLGVHLALTGVDHFSYERVGDRNRHIFVINRVSATGDRPDG